MTGSRFGELEAETVLATLRDAAELAGSIALPLFRTALEIDNKWTVGFDPVTRADREAEAAIRALIGERFPDHGIIGEEYEARPGRGPYRWIVDPIDGTRAFITGVPVWATLIGFSVAGTPVAGIMAQPFTGERWIGSADGSHYERAGERVRLTTSDVTELARARLTATSPDLFERAGAATAARWDALRSRAMMVRYGLDSYGYCLLAAGHIDLVAEAGLKPVDIAPLVPIIENAGGCVSTWEGGPPEEGGDIVAAANPELHRQALEALAGARRG